MFPNENQEKVKKLGKNKKKIIKNYPKICESMLINYTDLAIDERHDNSNTGRFVIGTLILRRDVCA